MNKNLHISFITKFVLALFIIVMSVSSSFATGSEKVTVKAKIIKCYPNPATSVINFEIQGADKNAVLQIYTFSGKKMTDVAVTSEKLSVILDNGYYRGIYVYQLKDKNGILLESGKFQVVK